ncbi:hypothetical protein ACFLZ3_00535 [Candidatus Omnitrophota bacterium]
MMKKIIAVVVMALFCGSTAWALEISAGPSYQDLDISGNAQSAGTRLDLEDDLGLGDDKAVGVNVRLDGKKHHFSFDYASFEFSGSKILTRSIDFQNKTYSISVAVETKLEYNLFEAQYQYDLLHLGDDELGVSLAPLLKLTVYDASLNLQGGGNNETYSEILPLPSAGVAAELDCTKYLSLLAQINGIGYAGDTYIEYRAVARLKPHKFVNIDIGYKGIKVDFSHSDDLLDLDINGLLLQGSFVYKF